MLRAWGIPSLLVVALAAPLAIGCSPSAAPPVSPATTVSLEPALPTPTPTTATIEPTPSASPLDSALSATTARGTARISVQILTAADGVDREITGEGLVDLAKDLSDIRWQSAAGPSREITTDEGFFVEVQPDSWLSVEPGRQTPTSTAGLPLRGLLALEDPQSAGEEDLDGTATDLITGHLHAEGNVAGMGLNDMEMTALKDYPQALVRVTLWVDDQGLIRQVMRTLEGAGPVAATTIARLSEFGVPAPVTAPASIAASAA